MKHLNNVTLIAVDTLYPGKAAASLYRSLKQIKPARTLLLTDVKMELRDIEVVQIEKIKSKEEYSKFIIKELYKYFDTGYVLITQSDSWVLCGSSWDDRFYEYSYIGATWLYVDGRNVGNGGFSLRTWGFQQAIAIDPFIQVFHPEDSVLARLYRGYLEEKYNFRFAPEELADIFSFELREPICRTFGFHSFFHEPYKPTIVFTRTGALGDIVQMEPVLRYYHNKGVRVVVNIPFYLMQIFSNHDFEIKHISEFDHGRIPSAHINLDGAYELKPDQLHLKSYYEVAEVKDGPIVNPKLSVGFDAKESQFKIFDKYVVLHLDEREEPHRQIRNVDWAYIVSVLKNMSYTVIQLGIGKHETVEGAIEMKTPNIAFLKWVIASADLMIGIDSGISNIASAFNIPSVIFSGSVDLNKIHPDMSSICWINRHDESVCGTPFCWNRVVSVNGQDCIVDKDNPPCVNFSTGKVLDKIKAFINEQTKRP